MHPLGIDDVALALSSEVDVRRQPAHLLVFSDDDIEHGLPILVRLPRRQLVFRLAIEHLVANLQRLGRIEGIQSTPSPLTHVRSSHATLDVCCDALIDSLVELPPGSIRDVLVEVSRTVVSMGELLQELLPEVEGLLVYHRAGGHGCQEWLVVAVRIEHGSVDGPVERRPVVVAQVALRVVSQSVPALLGGFDQ